MSTVLPPPTVYDACRTLLDTQPDRVQRLTNNAGSAVYRVATDAPPSRSWIIKLYRDREHRRARREHEALQRLTAVPTPFYVPAIAGWGAVPDTDAIALITEDLGDHLLHNAVQQGRVSRAKALASAGELLEAFHQLPLYRSAVAAPPLGQRLTTLAARLPAPIRLAVAGAFVDAISLVVERPAVLCHGDLHLCNVVAHWIYGTQGLAVIDFEEIGPAVPEWDVAQTTVTTDAWTDADRQPLLSGYGRPLDTGLLSRLITVQCVRGWYYASRGEGRDQTLWRRRLARSLSPANAPAPSEGHT